MLKSSHNKLRDRVADDYCQKGYHVSTEKQIGNRRVDIYAENEEEVLIIEVVDTSYSGSLDRKSINQIKIQINNKPISQHSANTRIGRKEPRIRLSFTIPPACLDWVDEKIKSRKYANRSHAIEVLVFEAIKRE